MAIGDTTDRLARQPRQIVILYLVSLRVEEIEHIELQLHTVIEAVAGAGIEDQRGRRTHAVILDQRTRTEIARLQVRCDGRVTDRYSNGDARLPPCRRSPWTVKVLFLFPTTTMKKPFNSVSRARYQPSFG